ncbi:pyruvate kinase [Campylobacter canadensis]|uniref:Pyruvate kinase n=1 Tax=Campylobacter canadensis TaxID=449520 RepID=A0ABS7WTK1_9BACT|nr:pyruvate kinase [Campylobacter canadensis]MBZ7987637.1 pyruvate kinase [Campylobacter canadensis]MBZ7995040.1 pyruvate kinase [Campylobacter canadensis]MBZ7996982.1 pyruvate kinase [Campylobacter canadensis]MBZ7998826.1 pyruvate kinase [Campylobacter canadensis]MBZ8000461.1 pyruvate kinase [Campylobacter canadensis]
MKKTKIIATLGPASENKIKELILAGVNVFRLNFSHGTRDYHLKNLQNVRKISKELGKNIGVLQDISGPKIRVLELPEPFLLKKDDRLDIYKSTINAQQISNNHYKVSTNYNEILSLVKNGEFIFLCDGSIKIEVVNTNDEFIECKVHNEGKLSSNKGINFPNTKINIDVLTQKDKDDLLWGMQNEVDFVAISFVQNAYDIKNAKEILKDSNISIFAKIEKFDAVENIDEILNVSDGIMVARGDLGIEVPFFKVPNIQKELIKKANEISKPVITATQMLFSLTNSKSATRAEISDVANAVLDGTDAVMLSEESAVGIDPVNAVNIMSATIIEVEKAYKYNNYEHIKKDMTDTIAASSVHLANDIQADALICLTSSGASVKKIARYRPKTKIITMSHCEKTLKQLSINWGIDTVLMVDKANSLHELLHNCVRQGIKNNILNINQKYVVTAGYPVGKTGSTNLIRILENEQIEYYLNLQS